MSGRRESLAVQLRRGMRDTIQKNRQMLCAIVETIVLCGRQNIALHGHCDSGTDLEVQGAPSNHGNFWALLISESQLATHTWGIIRVLLEMPHTHPLTPRISWSAKASLVVPLSHSKNVIRSSLIKEVSGSTYLNTMLSYSLLEQSVTSSAITV